MKFLHSNTSVTSRSKTKRTASQSAAYRLGIGKFKNRQDQVKFTKILLPSNTKHADFFSDPVALWQLVDMTEKRKDAQLFREFQTDFHNDIPLAEQIAAFEKFANENFVQQGMIANFAIHENQAGIHCHCMLTMREIDNTAKYPKFGHKCREWNNLDLVKEWRLNWQNELNLLAKKHNVEQVSFQSFETEQKIAVENQNLKLAAELEIKMQNKIKHAKRPRYYASFKEKGKKAKAEFLDSLHKYQNKIHNIRENLKNTNFAEYVTQVKSKFKSVINKQKKQSLENELDILLENKLGNSKKNTTKKRAM